MADAGPWILWVDGVGGYLVCPGAAVTLGQGFADPPADVPLLADVARNHAVIRRDGERYWLEASKPCRVNQKPATQTPLNNDDRICLGESCQLLFARPEPLSASARLSLVSGHRFGDPVDAVLLMAQTLILGPQTSAHVPVPELKERVVLVREGNGLAVKSESPIRIGHEMIRDRATLKLGVPTTIEDVTLTLELRSQ
jgi:FHA domain-containing protein